MYINMALIEILIERFALHNQVSGHFVQKAVQILQVLVH